MPVRVRSRDILRGDTIIARAEIPEWTQPALVIAARWYPDVLVLDLRWNDGKAIAGCALGADEEFTVERSDADLLIEAARSSLADYCRVHGL